MELPNCPSYFLRVCSSYKKKATQPYFCKDIKDCKLKEFLEYTESQDLPYCYEYWTETENN